MAGYSCSWGWKGEVITSLRKHSKKLKKKKKKRASGPDKVGPGAWGRYCLMSFTWQSMTVLSSAQRQAHGKPFFGVFLRHLLGVVLGRCRWNWMPFITNTFFQVNSNFVVPKTVLVRLINDVECCFKKQWLYQSLKGGSSVTERSMFESSHSGTTYVNRYTVLDTCN